MFWRAPLHSNANEYVQISLDVLYVLTGLIAQGSALHGHYVKQLQISYSIDCIEYESDETVSHHNVMVLLINSKKISHIVIAVVLVY